MTLPAGWHPVALSVSVDRGTSAGTRICGHDLVVWRDESGTAHVWDDRCPHRGMKLSFGFVRGDHIACLYHGWRYDTSGRCRYVPAHPDLDVPATIGVPVYGVVEAAGMIWMTADGEEARTPPPGGTDDAVQVASIHVPVGSSLILDAVRDPPPEPFRTGPTTASLMQLDGRLWGLTVGDDRLLLGLQDVAEDRGALHVAIAGSAEAYRAAARTHVFSWMRALRHRLETTAPSARDAGVAEKAS